MNTERRIKEFTDLIAWQEGHRLAISIYEITKLFPKDEVYGLSGQLRRAVVSIGSNIAEGFGRQTYPEKIRFYYIARGSASEVHNQLLVAQDIGLIKLQNCLELIEQCKKVHKLLTGLIKKSEVLRLES